MHRYVLTILLLAAAALAWAQDSAPEDEAEGQESVESVETAEEAADEQAEDLDLDEENYRDAEEEDFVPTEDIPADQAIPFPTDI
jgi:hypothetical protein